MVVIGTKVFKNNNEFVQWQKESNYLGITQIQPLYLGFNIDDANKNVDIKTGVSLFVVYTYDDVI